MGILDDLDSQPEQENKPVGRQPAAAGADEFYRAHIKQRMTMANDFFTQLVNKLNEKKIVIKAEYPFKPEGKTVTLLQQGYKAFSDHITDPRQLTLSYTCILANPTTYDVSGRAPALAQAELLDRYQFKHKKLEAKDKNQVVNGARFNLQGPLQVKCVLQFDEAKQIIKLLLTYIVGPGTSQYNLKPEQLDETFMDHLGKYLLRKEAKLFQEDISDDVKAMLRKKLQQEQLQREAELRAVEEQRKAEEAARKQNSTTQRLKNAVSQSVAENREKLMKAVDGQVREKGEKLKKAMEEQVREKGERLKTMFNKLKSRTRLEPAPEQTSASPAVNTSQAARPTGNPAVQGLPPINRQAGQTASAQQNATRPKPSADQKKPTPPKVFQASASNPFLKPEDFQPVPRGGEEQTEANADTKNPAAQLPAETATPAMTPTSKMSPTAVQAKPKAESNASAAKTAVVQTEMKKPTGQSPTQSTTPARPTMSPATAQVKSVVESNASVAKTSNPVMQTKSAAVQAETKKPTAQPPAKIATPATQTPMTSPAAEARPAAVPSAPVAKTAISSMQTKPLAAPDEPKLSLEPIASDAESSSSAAPDEPKLSLEPIASDAESSSPAAPDEPTLSLEPIASDAESSSAVAPAESDLLLEPTATDSESSSSAAPVESDLSLEPIATDSESSSSAAPVESELSLETIASDSDSSSLTTKTEEPQPEPSSDLATLSLEDELERDLAKFMESDRRQPSLEGKTSDAPPSTAGELDFDLSSPDALEIHFEDTDKASNKGSKGGGDNR
jgi:hypothetical protein